MSGRYFQVVSTLLRKHKTLVIRNNDGLLSSLGFNISDSGNLDVAGLRRAWPMRLYQRRSSMTRT